MARKCGFAGSSIVMAITFLALCSCAQVQDGGPRKDLVRQVIKTSTDDLHKADESFMRYLKEIEAEGDTVNWEGPPHQFYSQRRGFYR